MKTKYFSHDLYSLHDPKILKMRYKLGIEGYGIFWAIVEHLWASDSNELPKDYEILAFNFHCDVDKIRSVVEDFGLFVVENNVFFLSASSAEQN